MNYDDWKTANPYDDEKENECDYCGEPCNGSFCDSNCRKGYIHDN
ncbi:hypothetical protein B620_gp40 [Croceibacter phage P2559S]|nr:hypothetical protein B620_gp40 [Croceibacter phage P2559S]AFM54818.1 hypothetical protein P2559S_40 [Croceibacter phage P2559S]